MPSAESLVTFVTASTLLGLAPGPDNLFVLTQSALYGRRAGWLIVLGLCTGLVVHTSAVALGVAAVLAASTFAFTVLKAFGAAYLLYLAWQAFRAQPMSVGGHSASTLSGRRLYGRGILMNLTNPKVLVFFLAFLPQFADPHQGAVAPQILLLGLLFIGVTLIVFGGIALLAGQLGEWLAGSPRVQQWLNRIAGGVLAALALKLALSGV